MKYIVDRRIRKKYIEGFARPDFDVSHFIVHGTAGGSTAEANLKWMLNGGDMGGGKFRRDDYERGIALFQYIIDRNGDVYEIINPHNWVYHSSTGHFDARTIGCEMTNPDRNNGGTYTEEQYKALSELYFFVKDKFSSCKIIQGHGSIKKERTKSYEACPGTGFDWNKFNGLLITGGLKTTLGNEKIEVA